jgi:hypothetical protein
MKHRAEQRGGPLEVHTRFEASHLAAVCLAEAYTRLVPPVCRSLGGPAPAQMSAQAASQQCRAEELVCRGSLCEEDQQCS